MNWIEHSNITNFYMILGRTMCTCDILVPPQSPLRSLKMLACKTNISFVAIWSTFIWRVFYSQFILFHASNGWNWIPFLYSNLNFRIVFFSKFSWWNFRKTMFACLGYKSFPSVAKTLGMLGRPHHATGAMASHPELGCWFCQEMVSTNNINATAR